MRKHPLLAFITALITCSISGTVAVAGTDTLTPAASKTPVGNQFTAQMARALSTPKPHRHKARHRPHHHGPNRAQLRKAVEHPYATIGGIWLSLRSCESHDDYAENTGNGYYGAYQFSLATWLTVGGRGLPSTASAQAQDAAAHTLFDREGWAPWPVCSWKIGAA
jgi:hypothetical protein